MQLGMPNIIHHLVYISLATFDAVRPLVWCGVVTHHPLCRSTAAANTFQRCPSWVTSGITNKSIATDDITSGGMGVEVILRRNG